MHREALSNRTNSIPTVHGVRLEKVSLVSPPQHAPVVESRPIDDNHQSLPPPTTLLLSPQHVDDFNATPLAQKRRGIPLRRGQLGSSSAKKNSYECARLPEESSPLGARPEERTLRIAPSTSPQPPSRGTSRSSYITDALRELHFGYAAAATPKQPGPEGDVSLRIEEADDSSTNDASAICESECNLAIEEATPIAKVDAAAAKSGEIVKLEESLGVAYKYIAELEAFQRALQEQTAQLEGELREARGRCDAVGALRSSLEEQLQKEKQLRMQLESDKNITSELLHLSRQETRAAREVAGDLRHRAEKAETDASELRARLQSMSSRLTNAPSETPEWRAVALAAFDRLGVRPEQLVAIADGSDPLLAGAAILRKNRLRVLHPVATSADPNVAVVDMTPL